MSANRGGDRWERDVPDSSTAPSISVARWMSGQASADDDLDSRGRSACCIEYGAHQRGAAQKTPRREELLEEEEERVEGEWRY